MAGKYYARFTVKHEDKSDSYLRKAYTKYGSSYRWNLCKEKTDWLLMSKLEEKNVRRWRNMQCCILMIGSIVMIY